MRIHKAGYSIIAVSILLLGTIWAILFTVFGFSTLLSLLLVVFGLIILFIMRFFRYPHREIEFSENQIICPADGKVVVIERINENKFLKTEVIQVSIFMSVWNVHINWYPIVGKVLSTLHIDGKYMKAILPKSSQENERSVTVIESPKGYKVLVKQIAGAVARRIITYAKEGCEAKEGEQLGFIRFGSRVDVLIPTNANIKIKLNQKVTGGKTIIADL